MKHSSGNAKLVSDGIETGMCRWLRNEVDVRNANGVTMNRWAPGLPFKWETEMLERGSSSLVAIACI